MDGHRLVQIRNPWANEVEWNGPWSDSSPEWSDRMKHKLKHLPQVVSIVLIHACLPINILWFLQFKNVLVLILCILFNSRTKVYSGCLGKISRFISDRYMFVEYTLVRCAIQSMANGEVVVPVAAKIIAHGIRIRNSG